LSGKGVVSTATALAALFTRKRESAYSAGGLLRTAAFNHPCLQPPGSQLAIRCALPAARSGEADDGVEMPVPTQRGSPRVGTRGGLRRLAAPRIRI